MRAYAGRQFVPVLWWSLVWPSREANSRPTVREADTLPTEPTRHGILVLLSKTLQWKMITWFRHKSNRLFGKTLNITKPFLIKITLIPMTLKCMEGSLYPNRDNSQTVFRYTVNRSASKSIFTVPHHGK